MGYRRSKAGAMVAVATLALMATAASPGATAPADATDVTPPATARAERNAAAIEMLTDVARVSEATGADAARAFVDDRSLGMADGSPRQTSDCLEDIHTDPANDAATLDIMGHGAFSDCNVIVFLSLTRDLWPDQALGAFLVFIDADARPDTGCIGDDLSLGVVPTDQGLGAALLATPTCDSAGWTEIPAEAVASRTEMDDIGVVVDLASFRGALRAARVADGRQPLNGAFRWALGLSAAAGGTDFAPDTGSHDAVLRTPSPIPSTLRCLGARVTIMAQGSGTTLGTPGNDVIMGTPGRDVISARSGNDRVCAGGGNDDVDAGPGNDQVDLGPGDDRASGAAGNDRMIGGGGNDRMIGGGGRDTLIGGGGRDVGNGGPGNDVLRGGGGNDILDGRGGNDRIDGNGGGDRLGGAAGNDVLRGGGGPDVLRGGSGADLLDGAAGSDRCDPGAGRDRVRRCER